MGSRLRDNVKHLFECFCEVARPQGKEPAWVLQKFPGSYKDESVLKNVPKFAYPCKLENTSVEYYSFVLTDLDSKFTFGYCRHDPKSDTSMVIVSLLPWHESFYKLLNCVVEITNGSSPQLLWTFLEDIYNANIPEYGQIIYATSKNTEYTCQAPNQYQLPSIPENKNLTEYCAIEPVNMLHIFASMLYERRIVITSKRLSRVSACVQAANSVIYPMCWQHIFIPLMPRDLLDYLTAPMPYMVGLPEILLDSVRRNELGDVVLLNADTNVLTTPHDDLNTLPQDVIATLKKQLRNKTTGDGVARAFLRALVQLIGGYRDALKFHQGQEITFNDAAFVESRPAAMQPFLRKMLDLQIFQQFKEERLNMLNSGQGFTDEFEREACNYMDKSSGTVKQQYKEWLRTVGKEGRAFVKTWVRERGKDVRFVYKGLRSKLKEDKHGEAKSHSAPSSPTQLRKKDISIPLQSNKYSPLESPDLSPPLNINMDLMSDLQHVIFKDCSPTSVQKTMLQAIPSLPPPAVPAKPRLPEPDLIRLDSIDDVLPTSSQCAGVENPLYPYFVPKNLQPQPEKQEEASGSNSSSNSFKQNMDFFSNLSNSSSSQLKSPPSRPSSNYHKAFSFHGKSQDTSNSFDFLTSSSTHPTHTNGFTTSSISSTFPSEPLPSSQPKVLSTFMNHSQPPPLSPRKHSNSESKQNLPLNNLPVNAPRLPLVPTIGPPSYLSYPKPPVLNNGFSHPVQVTSNSSSSEFNSEAKDFFDSILNNNSTTYPSVAQRNGVFASKPSTSTYASRAAFLNEQLGPAVPSIAPKKSVSEWTKFD